MNCPNCHVENISALTRIFASAQNPIVCSSCKQKSLPGSLPASELLRLAMAAPLMLLALGGARFLSFIPWVESLLLALPLTIIGMAWLQLRLQLKPASPGDLQSSRAYNMLAGIAIAALGLLPWFVQH